MSEDLFFTTMQYLDSLFGEGSLSKEKTKKLANFSLQLGNDGGNSGRERKSSPPKYFTSPEETDEILSDVLSDDWWPVNRNN